MAVRFKLRFASRRMTTLATAHAPEGGLVVGGKQFSGGEFISADHLQHATRRPVSAVLSSIAEMYNNARLPSVTWDQIKQAFAELEQSKVSKAELEKYAAMVDVRSGGSRLQLIAKMKQSVMSRKGAVERAGQ